MDAIIHSDSYTLPIITIAQYSSTENINDIDAQVKYKLY